jgi:hypothetical protein
MSKNLDRYWQIEYILQQLWGVPHHKRDYAMISVYGKEQQEIKSALVEEERRQLEDVALTHH